MTNRVILITGTPCVGKTSVAKKLTRKLDAFYVNLTELAIKENLVLGKDKERDSVIVDEKKMKHRLKRIVTTAEQSDVIIDGHYAASVVPKHLNTYVFVLRRDPMEMRKLMIQNSYSQRKMYENLASEILDVCLMDALGVAGGTKVCEVDVTGNSVTKVVKDIITLLNNPSKCYVGIVDWLGKLESEGLLEEYLRI